jgi:integrase
MYLFIDRFLKGEEQSCTIRDVTNVHLEMITKKTANKDFEYSKKLEKFFGQVGLNTLSFRPKQFKEPYHILNKYIIQRAADGMSITTVNKELAFLNLLGKKAVDTYGLLETWGHIRPIDKDELRFYKLKKRKEKLALSYDMQTLLFNELPLMLRDMAVFSVNTGQRDSVVCGLRWDWLHDGNIPYFLVPAEMMKMGVEATVVLNSVARDIIYRYRDKIPKFVSASNVPSQYVFSTQFGTFDTQNCWAYEKARRAASVTDASILNTDVHSYKRTFVTRLYDSDVPHEWVQRLANHKLYNTTELYRRDSDETIGTKLYYLEQLVKKPVFTVQKGVVNG